MASPTTRCWWPPARRRQDAQEGHRPSKAGADKEVPPLRSKLALGKIAKFVAAVADNDMVKMQAAVLAGVVSRAGDKDHVIITASPIPQGVRVRLELEEGLLKALASMGQMLAPMGGVGTAAGWPPRRHAAGTANSAARATPK